MTDINSLDRAGLAAVVVETLANANIEVALVGGSCVCIYTNERFGSLDLDFIDLTYARKKDIAAALSKMGFHSRGSSRYFERKGCTWSIEFPSGPLAIGHEQVVSERLSKLETDQGTICLLNPTDCVKDRLLWWYLEDDRQCWEQAIDVARHHKLMWNNLKKWHDGEGYADQFESFQAAVKAK